MATRTACERVTALHRPALHDSTQQACCFEGRYEFERKATAHAEIFRLFADLVDDPTAASVQQDVTDRVWMVAAFLLGAIARDAFGGPQAAECALQYALDLAGPDQVLVPFLSHPRPGPPGRHDRHPSPGGTRIGPAADLLAVVDRPAAPPRTSARHFQALTHGETRVLHYLPTNLSAREIADDLYLSVNTVKTHQRHLYQKLGARSRTQAVQQARALGLLASSSRQPHGESHPRAPRRSA